jgi:hypothetical protein
LFILARINSISDEAAPDRSVSELLISEMAGIFDGSSRRTMSVAHPTIFHKPTSLPRLGFLIDSDHRLQAGGQCRSLQEF